MTPEAVVLTGAAAVLAVTLLSGFLSQAWLTEPIVVTVVGVLVAMFAGETPMTLESPLVALFFELTLALVLFADASRIDTARLRRGFTWPLRMLAVGLPLAIVLGAMAAWSALAVPLGLALLVGALLAPTDAALAEPVLEAEHLPVRVRQALNVESGLNDGLAVPVLLIALGLAGAESASNGAIDAVVLVAAQLGIGVAAGVALGWSGARVIGGLGDAGRINPLHQKIAAVALALGGFALVQLIGGSGFVAVFVAGAVMSHLTMPRCEYLYHFAETEGHTLVLLSFFILGAGPVADLLRDGVAMTSVIVAALALLVVRPVAIAVSLVGESLQWRTVWFLGWFGPRGLATVVFLLVAMKELTPLDPAVVEIVVVTVAASILLHGVSAVPLSRWLADNTSSMSEEMPEMGDAPEFPVRRN